MALQFGSSLALAGSFGRDAQILEALNDDGADIVPGRFVYRAGASKTAAHVRYPTAADFTARTRVFTPTWTALVASVSVTYQGRVFSAPHVFATDLTTSLAALATQLNELFDDAYTAATSIVATSDATTLTLTAEVAGDWFEASMSVSGGTVVPSGTAGDNLLEKFVGVVADRYTDTDTSGNARIQQNRTCAVVYQGTVIASIDSAAATTPETEFYIDVDGKLTTTRATDAVWVPKSMVRALDVPASSTLEPVGAVVRCRVNFNGAP